MYSVSDAYKNAIKNPVITYTITGTIGSLSFSAANLVAGSFNLSNQNCEANRMAPGGVFIGQLEAEFIGINLSYDAWMNKKITPSIVVDLGNNQTETIPLGIFKIKEAKHTAQGVRVKAYDNMIKLDRKFKKSHFHTPGSMKDFIDIVCTDCHLNLVNSEADINSMAQGSAEFSLYGASEDPKEFLNDIETYRDLVYWIAQSLGAFATINRNGDLWFRQFDKANVVDEVSDSYRLSGAEFESFQTAFTGVYFEDLDTGDVHYYGYDITALQAEVTTLTVERQNVQTDLADLETAYQQGQIDEATYKAQKKVYEREIKQLTKRINKLNALIAEMQDGDQDGTDIDCGSNPFMMNTNLTTRAAQRTAVLTAIQKAQFTPFTCSTILGVHYDLGDVIHFTGGHTSADGEYCIINSFDWTYNGEYGMQGFGSEDESKNIKTKEAKKAKQATGDAAVSKKIAESKPDVTVSTNPPSGGKTGDIHVQTGTEVHKTPKYEMTWEYIWTQSVNDPAANNKTYTLSANLLHPTSIAWDEASSSWDIVCEGDMYYEEYDDQGSTFADQNGSPAVCIALPMPESGTSDMYKYSFDVEYSTNGDRDDAIGISFQPETTGAPIAGFSPSGGVTPGTYADEGKYVEFIHQNDYSGPQHYTNAITIPASYHASTGKIRMFFQKRGFMASNKDVTTQARIHIYNFKFEKITDQQTGTTDGGYTETDDPYVGTMSVKDPDGNWRDVQRIADIETPTDPVQQEETGLQVTQDTRILSLRPNVVRAKTNPQPPNDKYSKPKFNQLWVQVTGKADKSIKIKWHGGNSWENKELKADTNGVYKISCGGDITGGVDYGAYKITGLKKGEVYYCNMGVDISNSTTFGNDSTKGCGIVIQDSGTINTEDWTGTPDSWNSSNNYYSFQRTVDSNAIDFQFRATKTTMYLCFVTGDYTSSKATATLSNVVISQKKSDVIRNIYIRDYKNNHWLKYVPFSAVTAGGDGGGTEGSIVSVEPVDPATLNNPIKIADITVDGDVFAIYAPNGSVINSLDDIGDVEITSPTTGQVLKYNATTQKWENGADTGGADAVEITWAAYQALPTSQKEDPTKVYYITDYPGGGGGGGTTVIANPTGAATETLNKLQVGSVIYGVNGGSGGGASITYGYDNPSSAASDGSMYILLNSNDKKQGTFLYMTNQWVLIEGNPYVQESILYDNGTENVAWEIDSASGTKNVDNISLIVGAGNYSHYAITTDPVDVTDFNTLSIQCRYRDQDYNLDFDISNYTGDKYISFTYLTDNSHNEVAVGLSDTKASATTFRVDSRNGGTAEAKLYYMSLKVV